MLEKTGYPETLAPLPSDLKTIDLERVFSLLRRHAVVLGFCILGTLTLATFYLTLAPRSYLSAGQVLLDRNLEQAAGEGEPSTSSVDLEAQVLNQIEVLRSSRVATAVAEAQYRGC